MTACKGCRNKYGTGVNTPAQSHETDVVMYTVGQSVVSIFEILERTYYITVHTRILLPC